MSSSTTEEKIDEIFAPVIDQIATQRITDEDIAKAKRALLSLIAEERLDEREGMQFFDDDGVETFKPYLQYRYTGEGLKVTWEERERQLQNLRNQTGDKL